MLILLILVLAIILGVGISIFANQNPTLVSIHLASLNWESVPLYMVVLVSLLFGLLLAFVFSFMNSISSSITIFGKDIKIKQARQTSESLSKRVKELETENARLSEKVKNTA